MMPKFIPEYDHEATRKVWGGHEAEGGGGREASQEASDPSQPDEAQNSSRIKEQVSWSLTVQSYRIAAASDYVNTKAFYLVENINATLKGQPKNSA